MNFGNLEKYKEILYSSARNLSFVYFLFLLINLTNLVKFYVNPYLLFLIVV